jgi:chaperonin GroES
MFKTFKPLYDKLLVSRIAQDEKTEGGIILAGGEQEKPTTGIVIEAGPGRLLLDGSLKELMVHKGDKVYFGKYAGMELEKDLLILKEDEIIGVIK